MKRFEFPVRVFLAIAGGLLLTGAFPNWNVAGLAWVAPAIILLAAMGEAGSRGFKLGFIAGLTHFLSSLAWLLLIPYRWKGVPVGPALGWFVLCSYVALYPAIWVTICWRAAQWGTRRMPGVTAHGPIETPRRFDPLAESGWIRRALWAAFCGIGWVALEMVRARLLTGFPWNPLGASQHQILPLIQISELTGVYGVSFLIVWFSAALLSAATGFWRSQAQSRDAFADLILPLIAVGLIYARGYQQVMAHPPTFAGDARHLKVALVQPAIAQEFIWNEDESTNRFNTLMRLSERAAESRPDLIIWPEAAMPALSQENIDAIRQFILTHRTWMIFGADDAEPRAGEGAAARFDFFNSAFLFAPSGEYAATYRKRRLVMFGEYIPLSDWLPFLKWIVPIGNFAHGKRVVPFRLTNPDARTAILICYEDIFPHHTREYVGAETDFLVNLTNDGWFGRGAAQWQQAVQLCFAAWKIVFR